MGKVILCAGRRADVPYLVRGTGIRVATIEELCYVLRYNLDMIELSVIDMGMAAFISDDLGLTERGRLLGQLVSSGSSMKDRIVAILCSCDLYDESEIRQVCSELEQISVMSASERRKLRADRYMKEGNYTEASVEYRSILDSEDAVVLSDGCRGDILHNLAVTEINNGEMEEAISLFLNAYEKNKREETLKAYLFALKLSKNTDRYRSEVQRLVNNVQLFNDVEDEVNMAEEDFEQSSEFTDISRLKVLWSQGRHSEEMRLSSEMIMAMKHMYRQEAHGICAK